MSPTTAKPRPAGGYEDGRWLDDEERHVFNQIDVTGLWLLERVRLFGAGELEAMPTDDGCHRTGDCDGGPPGPDAPQALLAGRVP